MNGFTRTLLPSDVPVITQDLRRGDVDEVKAALGITPDAAIYSGLEWPGADTLAICLPDGKPVGCYGICPTEHRVGAVWMLASNDISKLHRQLLRESRKRIKYLAKDYDLIYNFTDARNTVHHRWIKWAGFSIINKIEQYGVAKLPFYEFVAIPEAM